MSSLESRAWLQLWAMGGPYAVYFTLQLAAPSWFEGMPLLQRLACFGATACVHAAITIIGLLALKLKKQDGPLLDERDRAIEARATLAGYYTLMAGMIMVGVMLPFGAANPWKIVNAALLGIVVAEMVRHALIAMAYRKAARFAH